MAVKKAPPLFLREASGLVREVSTTKALFFNFASMMGGIAVWNTIWAGSYPASATFGLAPLPLAVILIALPLTLLSLIYVALLSAMPRTGGDYVFTSRIVHPLLGWLESWSLLWVNLTIFAAVFISVDITLNSFFDTMGVVYKNSGWSNLGSFFVNPTDQVAFAVVLSALVGAMALASTRKFQTMISVVAFAGVASILILLVAFPFISSSKFDSNFLRFSGNSTTQVVNTALSLPTSPLKLNPITFAFMGPVIGFALYQLIGFQYSAYIGGELKGNIKRNGMIAILGSLWMFAIFLSGALNTVSFSKFGYTFLHAWSYLYWNDPKISPIGGVAPLTSIYGLIASPNMWPLWLIYTLISVAMLLLLAPAYLFMTSRMVLAWSMDRLVPAWFSAVNPRTNNTVRLYVVMVIGALILYLMSFPPIAINYTAFTYFTVLLAVLTWIMPGFNALLVSFRRKDIFETIPFKRKVLGLPIVAWFGIIWLAVIIPIYALAFFEPLVSGIFASPNWQYASSSGILVSGGTILAGIIIYYISRAYNRRKGLDVDLIFKTLPPE
jgi:APA family basic amino acid/polyamine antiporter